VIATQGASALTVDVAGNLYVANYHANGAWIQKRDAHGNWSVIPSQGDALGQVRVPTALTMDTAENLCAADKGRIQKLNAEGNWPAIAIYGSALG
jgi:hypothetical protein